MNRHIVAALAILALLPVGEAFAEKEKKAGTPSKKAYQPNLSGVVPEGYGLAGCGLGSLVLGPQPGPIQIVAAILNGTGVQSSGITSGTSNCDIPEMGQQAAVFIEVNREILAKDAARGKGETVAGLASILNCSDARIFGENLQNNYEAIFTSKSSYDATRAIMGAINANPALAATCNNG